MFTERSILGRLAIVVAPLALFQVNVVEIAPGDPHDVDHFLRNRIVEEVHERIVFSKDEMRRHFRKSLGDEENIAVFGGEVRRIVVPLGHQDALAAVDAVQGAFGVGEVQDWICGDGLPDGLIAEVRAAGAESVVPEPRPAVFRRVGEASWVSYVRFAPRFSCITRSPGDRERQRQIISTYLVFVRTIILVTTCKGELK